MLKKIEAKLLLVDDLPENLLALRSLIQTPDRTVFEAGNADEALSLLLEHAAIDRMSSALASLFGNIRSSPSSMPRGISARRCVLATVRRARVARADTNPQRRWTRGRPCLETPSP